MQASSRIWSTLQLTVGLQLLVSQCESSNITDVDPEADDIPDGPSDSEDDTAVNGAREHYVGMEESKLRKPKIAALGPQYRGSRITRDAVDEDKDEDDPFGKGFGDEDSEDESDDEIELNDMNGSSVGDEDEDIDVTDRASDTVLSDEDGEVTKTKPGAVLRYNPKQELRKVMAQDQKGVVSSLAQSVKAEAEKGRAVKRQRSSFDSLLNARIKLQKTLVGANIIVGVPVDELNAQQGEAEQAIEAAETAAFNLWSSLNEFREHMHVARTGEKRKRSIFTASTPTVDLWKHVQKQEEESLPHRNAVLRKWAAKSRAPTALPEQGLLIKADSRASIVDVLREHLQDRQRLLKRAHTPRSCAPLQLSKKIQVDTKIYDDADFYGLLLKELLELKSQDSVAASNIDIDFSLRREAKTKKSVDTKASKGRKLRYTVHEKLQNFMALEDRGTWGERQMDELFGSLFGQRMGLGEERVEDDDMGDEVEDEEARLMLFRN